MNSRVLFWMVALSVGVVVAQTLDGEIAGRINDRSGAPLPGVRITITNGDQSREAVTDADGRLAFRSLAMGTYRVATLPIVSGLVTSPRARELDGTRVDEALTFLGNWSQARKR